MLVHRSAFRPAVAAPKTTKFQRDLRDALDGAKRRRKPPVTLPQLRALVREEDRHG